ncbi:MAG TPA: cardiolipin synthase [Desulfomicrobiaceae bacterium]|nr:cardiolipin synthase [Desulfomicrobiaceae bacterium]
MNTTLTWLMVLLSVAISLICAVHALIYKKDPRASLGWITVCLMFPVAGPVLYTLFGVNRIQSKAEKLKMHNQPASNPQTNQPDSEERIPYRFLVQSRTSLAVSGAELSRGNQVTMLVNGDQAYPAMLKSIAKAKSYIYLSTYIFESNIIGHKFCKALALARQRGVQVKILIDGIGQIYTWPWTCYLLKKYQLQPACFLPPKLLPPSIFINLRNHRKIIIIDGTHCYTGGINIGSSYTSDPKLKVSDVHFRMQGPITTQVEAIFLRDWRFTTGEKIAPSHPVSGQGLALCRAVEDGPNQAMNKLSMILVSAVSSARQKIMIMTPYFIPPRELIGALQAAALRGVDVSIILPQKNNLPFMTWATRNMLWELLQRGVQVYMQPPPFAHSKIFSVDGHYAQIGSANIDPRSLRLNFEMNIEIYDRKFTLELDKFCQQTKDRSRQITLEEVDGRSLPIRIRDSFCWLFSPYL